MKKKKSRALVILDFDGPILDSFHEGFRRLGAILFKNGVSFGEVEQVRMRHGWGKPGRLLLKEALGVSNECANQLYDEWVQLDNEEPPPLVELARETLEEMRREGVLLTMLTSRHWRELKGVFTHHRLQEFFELVQTADQGGFHKPDHRVFYWSWHMLTEKLNTVDKVYFVGDTLSDVEAGVHAGLETFLVGTGPHDPDFIRVHGSSEEVRRYFDEHPHNFVGSIANFPTRLLAHCGCAAPS